MQEYYRFRDRIIRMSSTCIFAVAIAGIIVGRPDIGLGILLGGAVSVFKFHYLSKTIASLQGQTTQSGKKIIFRRGMVRYGMSAACLAAAVLLKGHVNFWAVVVGLFAVMGVIFADQMRWSAITNEES